MARIVPKPNGGQRPLLRGLVALATGRSQPSGGPLPRVTGASGGASGAPGARDPRVRAGSPLACDPGRTLHTMNAATFCWPHTRDPSNTKGVSAGGRVTGISRDDTSREPLLSLLAANLTCLHFQLNPGLGNTSPAFKTRG